MVASDLPHERQAQADSAVATLRMVGASVESFEDPLSVLGGHTRSAIGDLDARAPLSEGVDGRLDRRASPVAMSVL